jgi:RimJ/RimL family protein N-acetyltransferase
MIIRKTILSDIDVLMEIFSYARQLMARTGNANQWIDGYPSRDFIADEILRGNSYVCSDDNGKIIGTFAFIIGNDPTYHVIEGGNWLNDKPYGVVHRLASNGSIKGVGEFCFNWCESQIANIRVDTHSDNIVMRHLLEKLGFTYCGIIYCHNGTPRLAYQKTIN